MPVTTRSGQRYDLTAADRIITRRRENTDSRRAARGERLSDVRAVDQSQDT